MAIPTAICMECSSGDNVWEFPSMRDLIAHKSSGHKLLPPKKVLPPSPEKGPSATEMKAGDAANSPAAGKQSAPASKVVDSSSAEPLILVYKWQGKHVTCNSEVKTIAVDLGKTQAIIAYCLNCDRNVMQQMVIPIAKQPKQQLGSSLGESEPLPLKKK